jgi:hypothetical protein
MPLHGPPPSRGKLGPIGGLLLVCGICWVIGLSANTYYNRYHTAKRLMSTDPDRAIGMLVEEVRDDKKASIDSLMFLCSQDGRSALKALVGLMNLSDGHWNGVGERNLLWASIQRQTRSFTDTPPYDPAAEVGIRWRQMEKWEKWLGDHGFANATSFTE